MSLSARQEEIVELVVKGFSNREIAERLQITEKTVKFHLTNIYALEGVLSRAQLIVKNLREGINDREISAFREILKSNG